jgi:hypothetical protein
MRLSAPSQTLWIIAVILGGLGILSRFVRIPNITSYYSFWLVAAGFIILVIATASRRM